METDSAQGTLYSTSKQSSTGRRRRVTLQNKEISANATFAPNENVNVLANGFDTSSYESLCKPLSICITRLSENVIQKALDKISIKPMKRRKRVYWKRGQICSHRKLVEMRIKRKILEKQRQSEFNKRSSKDGKQKTDTSIASKENTPVKHTSSPTNSVKRRQKTVSNITPTKPKHHIQTKKLKKIKVGTLHNIIGDSTPTKQTQLTQFMVPLIKNIQTDYHTMRNTTPTKQTECAQSTITKGSKKEHSSNKGAENDHCSVSNVISTKQIKEAAFTQFISSTSKNSKEEYCSAKSVEKDCDTVANVTPAKRTKQVAVMESISSTSTCLNKDHNSTKSVIPVKQVTVAVTTLPISSASRSAKEEHTSTESLTPGKQVSLGEITLSASSTNRNSKSEHSFAKCMTLVKPVSLEETLLSTSSTSTNSKNEHISTKSVTPVKQVSLAETTVSASSTSRSSKNEHSSVKNVTPVKQVSLAEITVSAASTSSSSKNDHSSVKRMSPVKQVSLEESTVSASSTSRSSKNEHSSAKSVTPVKQVSFAETTLSASSTSRSSKREHSSAKSAPPVKPVSLEETPLSTSSTSINSKNEHISAKSVILVKPVSVAETTVSASSTSTNLKNEHSSAKSVTPVKEVSLAETTLSASSTSRTLKREHSSAKGVTPVKQVSLEETTESASSTSRSSKNEHSSAKSVTPVKQVSFAETTVSASSTSRNLKNQHSSVEPVTPVKQVSFAETTLSASSTSRSSKREHSSAKSVTPVKPVSLEETPLSTSSTSKNSKNEHISAKSVTAVKSVSLAEITVSAPSTNRSSKNEHSSVKTVTPVKQLSLAETTLSKSPTIKSSKKDHSSAKSVTPVKQVSVPETALSISSTSRNSKNEYISAKSVTPVKQVSLAETTVSASSASMKSKKEHSFAKSVTPVKPVSLEETPLSTSSTNRSSKKEHSSVKTETPVKQLSLAETTLSKSSTIKSSKKDHSSVKSVTTVKQVSVPKSALSISSMSRESKKEVSSIQALRKAIKTEYNVIVNVTPNKQIPSIQSPTNELCAGEEELIDVETISTEDLSITASEEATFNDEKGDQDTVTTTDEHFLSALQSQTPMVKIPICNLDLSWSDMTNTSTDAEETQTVATPTPNKDVDNCSVPTLQDAQESGSKNHLDDSNGWKFRRKRGRPENGNSVRRKRMKKRHVMWADEESAKNEICAQGTSPQSNTVVKSNMLVETQHSIKSDDDSTTTKKLQISLLKLEDMLEDPLVKNWHLQKTKHSTAIELNDSVDTHPRDHSKLIIKRSGTSTYTSHIITSNEPFIPDHQDEKRGQTVDTPSAVASPQPKEDMECLPISTHPIISVESILESPHCKYQEEENTKHKNVSEQAKHTEIIKDAEDIKQINLSENQSNTDVREMLVIGEKISRFDANAIIQCNLMKEPRVLLWRLEDLGVSLTGSTHISVAEVDRLTEAYTSTLKNNTFSSSSLISQSLTDDNSNDSDVCSVLSESSNSDSYTPNDCSETAWTAEAKSFLSSLLKSTPVPRRRKPKRIIRVVTRLPKSLRTTKKHTIGNAMIYETIKESLVSNAALNRSKLPTIISSEILRGSDIVSTGMKVAEVHEGSSPTKELKTSQDSPKICNDQSVPEQKEMLNVWKTAFLSVDDKKIQSGFDTVAETRVWKHHIINSPSSSETERSPSIRSMSAMQSSSTCRPVASTPLKGKICETEPCVSKDKSTGMKSTPSVKKYPSFFNRKGVYTCTECKQWYIHFEKLKKHFKVCPKMKSKQLSAAKYRAGPRFTKVPQEIPDEGSIDVRSREKNSETVINVQREENPETEISTTTDTSKNLDNTLDKSTAATGEFDLENTADESTCNEESISLSKTISDSDALGSSGKEPGKSTVKSSKKRKLRQSVENLTCNICQWIADSKNELFNHVYKHSVKELQTAYKESITKAQDTEKTKSGEKSRSEINNSSATLAEETSSEKTCNSNKQPSTPSAKHKSKFTKEQTSPKTTSEKTLDTTPTKASSTSAKSIAKIGDIPEDKLKLVSKKSPTISLSKLIVICECHKNEGLSVNHVSNTDALQIEINLFCRICRVLFRRIDCFETHYRNPKNSLCNQDRLFGRSPRLFCNSCRVVLSSVIEMRRHLEMHFRRNRNGTVSFVCNLCKVIFIGIGEFFYSHWTSHSKDAMYLATAFSFRKLSLVSQEQFIDTLLNDEKVKEKYLVVAEHVCRDCKAIFELQAELIAHEPDCRRQTLMHVSSTKASSVNIQNDIQAEPNTPQQSSDSSLNVVKQPLKIRFICGLCNMSFIDEDAFQKHEGEHMRTLSQPQYYRVPTKTKDTFLCKTCVNIFDDFSIFKNHWTVHIKSCKDFVCISCEKRFKSKALLLEHITENTCNIQIFDTAEYRSCRVEYFDSTFACKDCKQCFKDERCLTEHMITFHKDRPTNTSDSVPDTICETRKTSTSSSTETPCTVRKSQEILSTNASSTESLLANTEAISIIPSGPSTDNTSSLGSSSTSTKNVSQDIQSTSKKSSDSRHNPSLQIQTPQDIAQNTEPGEKHIDDDNESDSEGRLVIELRDTDDEDSKTDKTEKEKTNKVPAPRTIKESPDKSRSSINTTADNNNSGPELIILDDAESPKAKTQPRVSIELRKDHGKNVEKNPQPKGGTETESPKDSVSNDAPKETVPAPPKKGFLRVKTLAELGQRTEYPCTTCTRRFTTHEEMTTHQWEIHSTDAIDELLRDLTEDPPESVEEIVQLANTNSTDSTREGANVSRVKPCVVRQRTQPLQERPGHQQQSQNGQMTTRALPYTTTYHHQQQSSVLQQRLNQLQPQQQFPQAVTRPIGGKRLPLRSKRNLHRQQQQQYQQQQQPQQQQQQQLQHQQQQPQQQQQQPQQQQQQSFQQQRPGTAHDAVMMHGQMLRPHVQLQSGENLYKVPEKYASAFQHLLTYVPPMLVLNTPPSSTPPTFTTGSGVTSMATNMEQTQVNKPTQQPNINSTQSNLSQMQLGINPSLTNMGHVQTTKFALQPNVNTAQSNLTQLQPAINPTQPSITQLQSSINPTQTRETQLQTNVNPLQRNVAQFQSNNGNPMQPSVIALQTVVPQTVYTPQHSQQGQYFFPARRGESQIQNTDNAVVATHYSTQANPAVYWSSMVPNYNTTTTTYMNSGICDVSGQQSEHKQKAELIAQSSSQPSGYHQPSMPSAIMVDHLTIRQQYPLMGSGGTTIHVNNVSSDPMKCITIQPTIQPQQQQQQQQQQPHGQHQQPH